MPGLWRHDLVTGAWGTVGRTYLVLRTVSPPLADACLQRVLAYWKQHNPAYGQGVVDDLWVKGHRPPAVRERHAIRGFAAGREADIRAALSVCEGASSPATGTRAATG